MTFGFLESAIEVEPTGNLITRTARFNYLCYILKALIAVLPHDLIF